MGECFLTRRGGSNSIDIRTICITSTDDLPLTAKDGTVAIVSETKPKNVWIQNTEPSEFKDGDVWMYTASKSSAPIQKGFITIYPSMVKQYQEGAWIGATCYIRYQDEWVPLELFLFETGNSFNTVTGGWKTYATQSGTSVNDVENMIDGKNIVITMPINENNSSQYHKAVVGTNKMIPAGRYKTLVVKGTQTYISDIDVGFAKTMEDGLNPDYEHTCSIGGGEFSGTKTIDISTLGDDYEGYLFIHAVTAINSKKIDTITITDIYLTN